MSQSITPKISSLGLIIKHEQFNLNYSTKHIISQKYFVNTIPMNSETLGLLFPAIHQSSVHFVNPNFVAISDPIHITIQFVSQIIQLTTPNSPSRSLISQMDFNKFKQFGSKIWDRSNGHSRLQSTQTS